MKGHVVLRGRGGEQRLDLHVATHYPLTLYNLMSCNIIKVKGGTTRPREASLVFHQCESSSEFITFLNLKFGHM